MRQPSILFKYILFGKVQPFWHIFLTNQELLKIFHTLCNDTKCFSKTVWYTKNSGYTITRSYFQTEFCQTINDQPNEECSVNFFKLRF